MPTPNPTAKPNTVLDTQSRAVARAAIHDGRPLTRRP
jgi:hypothetical protein